MFKFMAEWLATMSAAFFVATFIEGTWWFTLMGIVTIWVAIKMFNIGEKNGE